MKITQSEKKMVLARRELAKAAKLLPGEKKKLAVWEKRNTAWSNIQGISNSCANLATNLSDKGHLVDLVKELKGLGDKDKSADFLEELKAVKGIVKKTVALQKLAAKQRKICFKQMMKIMDK